MRSTLKLVLLFPLICLCIKANAQWLKKAESSDDLYKEAKREIDLKYYQKAIIVCNRALDISPHNLDIHLLLGRSYALAGKVDSARLELNYVLQRNVKYKDAYDYLVNLETVACNYSQALEYADQGLKYYPNDRDLLLKKLDIYSKQGDWIESTKLADYLFERFSTDAYIRSVYLDYKLTLARQYSHRGYIEISKRAYESVLEQDPLNKEALQAVFALDVRSGNYESSLAFTNRALQSSPNSYEFLLKKISILDAMSRYVEAIEVVQKLMKLYPSNTEVQKLNIYLRMEAGKYYMNTDPYLQFQAVLEKQPTNLDALNYVINIAYSRGLLTDALMWVNIAIKHYPNDHELYNKKIGILEGLKRYDEASRLAESAYKSNPTPNNKAYFLELRTLAGKMYINSLDYDSAAIALKSVLFYDHSNKAAINYLISAYSQQRRYDDALHVIDDALTYYPGNEELLFKKAGVLEAYQKYAEAALISKQLLQKFPESRQYLVSFVEQSLEAGKESMQYDDYYNTIRILQEVLDVQPDNVDALNYIINLETADKQFDSALAHVDLALHYYPDSKDFLFKKSSVLADAKRFREAYAISGDLYNNYPYNIRYRTAYKDQLLGSGREYLADNKKDSALIEFNHALSITPKDTLALYYTINLLMDTKSNDSALVLIGRGRSLYPNNTFFLLKRAQVYEDQKEWKDAWLSADTLTKMIPFDAKIADYAEYLYSKTLKNEFGFFYLHSTFTDTTSRTINGLATVQYTRFFKNGSITARVNYAGRFTGTGFQYEAEAYYTIAKRLGLYGIASYSPDNLIFPAYRYGFSVSFNFNKGWTPELGIRYLSALDSGKYLAGIAGLTKEFKEMAIGLKGYVTQYTNDLKITNIYYSAIQTCRFYVTSTHSDYFSTILGYGTIPDDFSRNYELSHIINYNTISVGAGYSKQFHYRTTIGIFGTWYNEQTGVVNGNKQFLNQYDIYLTLLRRF